MKKAFGICLIFITFAMPVCAQQDGEVMLDKVSNYKARVLQVVKDEVKEVPGTGVQSDYQTLSIEILEGPQKGKVISVEEDYVKLKKGDVFYLIDTIRLENGAETYAVGDPYRLPTLYLFAGLFVVLVIMVGGFQGLRGLLSLVGSFLLIFYALLPGILHGYSPIMVSIIVSSFIIIVGSYITHGFNKTTSSAVIGMIITVIVTGILAFTSVHMANLTGYNSEDAVYLYQNTHGTIDIIGILLGGFMIGLLGVLYDVAIGQAISVEELHHIAPHIPRRTIYLRSLRIGREHIGALVNTLAIAYVGASLPLLLLFTQSSGSFLELANREVFATEILRTLIGSIGLVLAVPITTLLAVLLLIKRPLDPITQEKLEKEKHAIEHFEHHH